jgi:hypothetical protein
MDLIRHTLGELEILAAEDEIFASRRGHAVVARVRDRPFGAGADAIGAKDAFAEVELEPAVD